mmetsp:Transcript_12599/g.26812  ORF Transcript_12599/g.26812 Transcript_12599/m.26812 type:complete len:125 (+) Transcript_12599:212-586(+)
MNATTARHILLKSRMLSRGQHRSLHAVSSTIDAQSIKSSQGTHKQSQSNYVATATEEQIPLSAKDIQQLLSNIGADYRASLPKIESMIQKNKIDDDDHNHHCDDTTRSITSHQMIDLIAQIRSL